MNHQGDQTMCNARAPFAWGACVGLLLVLLVPAWVAAAPKLSASDIYELEIRKSERLLLVKLGDRVTREFPIAFGRGGGGDKRQVGDNKTPVGTYRVVRFNDNSRFHLFMHLNYPNVKDAFFGLKSGIISRREFDAILAALKDQAIPPQDTPLGGYIGIHGIGDITPERLDAHLSSNWTEGCIALTNDQIQELRRYVSLGTKVVINE